MTTFGSAQSWRSFRRKPSQLVRQCANAPIPQRAKALFGGVWEIGARLAHSDFGAPLAR